MKQTVKEERHRLTQIKADEGPQGESSLKERACPEAFASKGFIGSKA